MSKTKALADAIEAVEGRVHAARAMLEESDSDLEPFSVAMRWLNQDYGAMQAAWETAKTRLDDDGFDWDAAKRRRRQIDEDCNELRQKATQLGVF